MNNFEIKFDIFESDFRLGLRTLEAWKNDPAPIESKVREQLNNAIGSIKLLKNKSLTVQLLNNNEETFDDYIINGNDIIKGYSVFNRVYMLCKNKNPQININQIIIKLNQDINE